MCYEGILLENTTEVYNMFPHSEFKFTWLQLGDHEVEVIEENTIGQVVQGEDGEFYVVVDDSSPDVSGLRKCL